MNIVINWKNLQKRIINWQEVQKVIRKGVQIRPESTPPTPTEDYLCFTTRSGNAQIRLRSYWNPNPVSLEISSDKTHWSDYTIWDYISLPNVWDKIYFRNKSETVVWFSKWWETDLYDFEIIGNNVEASWDVNYLLCKYSTTTLQASLHENCFSGLFAWCPITTAPSLPATTLAYSCYQSMFVYCTSLTTIPALPAGTLLNYDYAYMFQWCTNIKISETQTWEYQTPYRMPSSWPVYGEGYNSLFRMFYNTWWTFTWTPIFGTTYYTSNTVI